MSDDQGKHTMGRPRFRNDLNWNTVLSILLIVGMGAGIVGTYAVVRNQQTTNTRDIGTLKDVSARQETRIKTLEINRANDVARTEDFKKDVLNRVDKLANSVSDLIESNASLAATIRQQEKDRNWIHR